MIIEYYYKYYFLNTFPIFHIWYILIFRNNSLLQANQVRGPDRSKQGAGIMAIMDEMKHDIELEVAELKHDEEESEATCRRVPSS